MDDMKLSQLAKGRISDSKGLRQSLLEGTEPLEIVGYSDETMAKFYGAAYKLFEEKRYHDAADAFLFLCHLDSNRHEYWLGLGMATQMTHDYEGAIDAYELSAICDITSPVPYFYLAKCLFAIHDHESSLEALNMAIESAEEREEYADLREQAIKARDVLLRSREA